MFNMEEDKTIKTPMSSSIKLDKDEKCKSIDSTMYGGMIGERRLPLGHRASALLSRLSLLRWRLVERRGLTRPFSAPWRIIRGPLHSDGLAASSYDFGADFPDSGGHRDEVSYLEAFLVDSILMGRRIHVGYLMMMHMISCCESTTRILPYGHFLTRVFKDVGVDLSRERNFKAPSIYDTYDEQSLGRMKFEKTLDGSWFEATFPKPIMSKLAYTTGPSSQPSFTKPPYIETSPHQTPHTFDYAPWMDLSAQIISLGTHMEELAVVSDTRLYSMEDRMHQYQTDFTF
ncbi:hypothetical protein CK203_000423 [Vitis vinifera]|uniref:Uncharacterized protein n=1 Tax=Vitis vinifera TaxID=29760 RepID=A0A438KQ70_VITVI|nr:hypothetical protein CK203_000423 [Vitis vinifera]